jgi:hypothetical protein
MNNFDIRNTDLNSLRVENFDDISQKTDIINRLLDITLL